MKHAKKLSLVLTIITSIYLTPVSFAAENSQTVKFYFSNNTGEISLNQAYTRFSTAIQQDLLYQANSVLQRYHVEEGNYENVLGTYQMSTDGKLTADNTAIFESSPYQQLSQDNVFNIAHDLAVQLQQDSVAVVVPQQGSTSPVDIKLYFKGDYPSVQQVVDQIHNLLPASYQHAFSLHLVPNFVPYSQAKVNEVEWLGSSLQPRILAKAFPNANVQSENGQAYLVFQSGKISEIN